MTVYLLGDKGGMNVKIVETLWFNGFKGSAGIVIAEEEITKARVAYIGVTSSKNVKADTDSIISFGNPFSVETAQRIVYLLGGET